jgi:VanZ family protein
VSKSKRLSTHKYETTLNRLSPYLYGAVIQWTLTLIWTALTVKLMLSPSGDGTTVSWVSKLFGGTETTDAIGHIIINAILAFLWCWTISLYTSTAKMSRIILIGGIIWCFGAELSQFLVPNRGASLIDLGANIVGVLIGLIIFRLILAFSMKQHQVN